MDRVTTQRLVIVSNRLPFSAIRGDSGFEYSAAAGGLATGLSSYLSSIGTDRDAPGEYVWVGWPGATIPPEDQQEVARAAMEKFRSIPVFLSEEEMEKFYLGFCNRTLWPLLHSFSSMTAYDEDLWESYRKVNERFCDSLCEILREGDIVWIHDYHLMLLPRLLREKIPAVHIGFFLHIPFPSYEIFRLLPSSWRRDLLQGLLGADLVGFHTYEYTHHFLQSVLRILGFGNNLGQILLPDRGVSAETFPMGINYRQFSEAVSSREVAQEVAQLRAALGDVKIILSVDRLDYTKGILNRLEAFEIFLAQHPEWHQRLVLVLVVVPSRVGVDYYDRMKRQLEEQVGRINGKHGTIGWTPVVYQFRNVPFVPLVALYAISDVALVTPLRDGMNLIAKEYVASRNGDTGVLILSEMAGAVKELGEALIINPNHCGEISAAIAAALEIPVREQARKLRSMQLRLQRYTVHRWANDFVRATVLAAGVKARLATKGLTAEIRAGMMKEYSAARHRLFLLDYDGTLVPYRVDPASARPGRRAMTILKTLAADPANHIVIISGRDRKSLGDWLGELPITLVAEHGFFVRKPGGEWIAAKVTSDDWKVRLLPVLHRFADRVPGAIVEEKEHALVWHYRGADPEQGETFAHELTDNLNALTGNIDVQVIQANQAIEIRDAGINKGTVAREIMSQEEYGFILAAGDDRTDEDTFQALPDRAYTIRVGGVHSHARFNCRDSEEALWVLSFLADRRFAGPKGSGPVRATLRLLAQVTRRLAT